VLSSVDYAEISGLKIFLSNLSTQEKTEENKIVKKVIETRIQELEMKKQNG
jgi:hypothetical protein